MKSLIAVGLLALSLNAQAQNILPGQKVLMSKIDAQITQNLGKIVSGTVQVNLSTRKMSMTLGRVFYCPPGRFCSDMMPLPINISVDLTRVYTNGCGGTVYEGRKDLRPLDGSLNTLQVIDNSTETCLHIVAPAQANVVYTTSYFDRNQGREVQSSTRLNAQTLTEVKY